MKGFITIVFALTLLASSAFAAKPTAIDGGYIRGQGNIYRNFAPNPIAEKNTAGWTASSVTISRDSDPSYAINGISSFLATAATNPATITSPAMYLDNDVKGQCEARMTWVGDGSKWAFALLDGSNNVLASVPLTNRTDYGVPASISYPCANGYKLRAYSTAASPANFNYGGFYWGPATNFGTVNVVTDWTSYPATGSWVANTTYVGRSRRVGDSLEGYVEVQTSGAPTAVALTINIPPGLTIDTAKIPSTDTVQILGDSTILDSGNFDHAPGKVAYSSATAVRVMYTNIAGGVPAAAASTAVTNNVPIAFGVGDKVWASFRVPIVGWTGQNAIRIDSLKLPTVTRYLTPGSGTYTTPINPRPTFLKVTVVGGGGSGAAGGTGSPGNGNNGGASSFGNISANGGAGASVSQFHTAAAGGTVSVGADMSYTIKAQQGGFGDGVGGNISGAGGRGGSNPLSGGGGSQSAGNTGKPGLANTGGGGSGGSGSSAISGAGGGAGGYVEGYILNPAVSYSYAVGNGGGAAVGTANGGDSGAGGTGAVIIEEFYGQFQTPLLTGGLQNSYSGIPGHEAANIYIAASGCAVNSQLGNWISNPNACSPGYSAFTLSGFRTAPYCTVSAYGSSGAVTCTVRSLSATSVAISCFNTTTGANTDLNATLLCTGGK